MAVADRHGLPIAVGIASGQRNEQKLVVETLNARFVDELPKKLIGDAAYDSDPLDAELARMGVEMIAPHHPNRKQKTQDLRNRGRLLPGCYPRARGRKAKPPSPPESRGTTGASWCRGDWI
jgi:hypothetical protein